jgi:hypothetical protein
MADPEPDHEVIPRKDIFTAIVAEAGGYYKLVITVASSFLGGSLLFLEKNSPKPSALALVVLLVGWVFLLGSIVSIAHVRRLNLESGWHTLEKRFRESGKIDRETRAWSQFAVWLLGLGLLLVLLFGFINLLEG